MNIHLTQNENSFLRDTLDFQVGRCKRMMAKLNLEKEEDRNDYLELYRKAVLSNHLFKKLEEAFLESSSKFFKATPDTPVGEDDDE